MHTLHLGNNHRLLTRLHQDHPSRQASHRLDTSSRPTSMAYRRMHLTLRPLNPQAMPTTALFRLRAQVRISHRLTLATRRLLYRMPVRRNCE